jgi:hypothetical protein
MSRRPTVGAIERVAMRALTELERRILTAATKRESGLVLPLPKALPDHAQVNQVLRGLLDMRVLAVRPRLPGEVVWHRRRNGVEFVLVISPIGLRLMGIEPIDHVERRLRRGSKSKEATASHRDGRRPPAKTALSSTPSSSRRGPVDPRKRLNTRTARPGTKLARLIQMLRSRRGATLSELTAATGWQPHSVRGALSGAIGKQRGLRVSSDVNDKRGRVYSIRPRG